MWDFIIYWFCRLPYFVVTFSPFSTVRVRFCLRWTASKLSFWNILVFLVTSLGHFISEACPKLSNVTHIWATSAFYSVKLCTKWYSRTADEFIPNQSSWKSHIQNWSMIHFWRIIPYSLTCFMMQNFNPLYSRRFFSDFLAMQFRSLRSK